MIRGVNGSLGLADLAYIETPGPPAVRVQAAIWAYLWSSETRVMIGDMKYFPSLGQLREALAAARVSGELS